MAVQSASARLRMILRHEDIIGTGADDWPLTAKVNVDHTVDFTAGTGANQFDINYMQERTVGDGANDDIDLAGVLSDAFGSTITAAEICALVILNEQEDGTANTTNLTIGAGSNPFQTIFAAGTTKTIGPIRPGGAFVLCSPAAAAWAVTAGTADILRIANSAGAANTYQIAIWARTA